jgi:hypothetical protein
MDCEYYFAGFVCENCVLLGCCVIEELDAFLHGCFCWGGFFGCKGTEGVSIVPLIPHAKNKNTPVTSWMNFFPALSSNVSSIDFTNCFFAPCMSS